MFVPLAGAQLALMTGDITAPTPIDRPDAHFLAPAFVKTWATHIALDPLFAPIMRWAAESLGQLVDRNGTPLTTAQHQPKGGAFLVRCGLLYRRGQGEADRLCVPAGGHLRDQVLRECHDGPLGATLVALKRLRWCDAWRSGWDRIWMLPTTSGPARPANGPRPTTADPEACSTHCHSPADAAG